MTIDEIKSWCKFSGIGHIALSFDNGWATTACGHWVTAEPIDRPKKICRKCRSLVGNLRKVGK